MENTKLKSFFRNYFRFENSYFTVGGWKKEFAYFLRMGSLGAHLVDRVKFRIYPKLNIIADFPSHLDIETASACQMRCPMCYTTYMDESLKGIMKYELYTKLVDEASSLGVYSIKLSWRGEPLLNKDIVKMVKYAKNKGIKEVAFLSNAEFLTEEMAEALVDAGLDWLSISADGTGEIYNEIRRPAIFEETLERVAYMKKYRDSKGLTRPLLRVQSIMSAVEDNPDDYKNAWAPIVDRMNIIADETRDFNEKDLQFDRFFVCAKPWQRMTIAYDGKVHQCISDYGAKNVIGDTNETSLYDVWHGPKNQAVRDAFLQHKYLEENAPCNICSYGVITEKSKLKGGDQMYVRRYASIAPVVIEHTVTLKAPKPAKIRKSVADERARKVLEKEKANDIA
ncbi:MAG TPA: radical SAM protein [Methylotenera sp.]|nr:radical SAM protein [Methylotenera sp.]